MATLEEERNIENIMRWSQYYNTKDLVRFVYECYTRDAAVYAMGAAELLTSEVFLQAEETVAAAAPNRYLRLDHFRIDGNNVTIENTLLDPDQGDFALPWTGVFTMSDGKIAVDRTYAEWARWPGVSDLAQNLPVWDAKRPHCEVCRKERPEPEI
jgi:hypothetical protein